MVDALASLLLRSSLLVLLTAALFWCVAGAAAARCSGRSRLVGALVGGVLPVLGAPLMLLPRRGVASTPRPPALQPSPSGLDGWNRPTAPTTAPVAQVAGSGFARQSTAPAFAGLSAGAPRPGATSGFRSLPAVHAPAPQPLLGPFSGDIARPPASGAGHAGRLLLLVPAALAVLALLASAVQPWLVVRTADVQAMSVRAATFGATGFLVIGAAALLAVVAVLHVLRPRGTWAVLGAAVGATALLVSLELLLATDAATYVVAVAGDRVPRGTGLRAGRGARSLLLAGILSWLWAFLAVATCPARVPSSRS